MQENEKIYHLGKRREEAVERTSPKNRVPARLLANNSFTRDRYYFTGWAASAGSACRICSERSL